MEEEGRRRKRKRRSRRRYRKRRSKKIEEEKRGAQIRVEYFKVTVCKNVDQSNRRTSESTDGVRSGIVASSQEASKKVANVMAKQRKELKVAVSSLPTIGEAGLLPSICNSACEKKKKETWAKEKKAKELVAKEENNKEKQKKERTAKRNEMKEKFTMVQMTKYRKDRGLTSNYNSVDCAVRKMILRTQICMPVNGKSRRKSNEEYTCVSNEEPVPVPISQQTCKDSCCIDFNQGSWDEGEDSCNTEANKRWEANITQCDSGCQAKKEAKRRKCFDECGKQAESSKATGSNTHQGACDPKCEQTYQEEIKNCVNSKTNIVEDHFQHIVANIVDCDQRRKHAQTNKEKCCSDMEWLVSDPAIARSFSPEVQVLASMMV